jgi:glycosidase
MKHWAYQSVFYHIYPLGFCGAPEKNDFSLAVEPRLEKANNWINHLKDLGVNAVYLGPTFQSATHGYDTVNYFKVDRRLGDNQTLVELVANLHQEGIKVILDGVFNHVGRDFWAFKDVLEKREDSKYCDWFSGLDFSGNNPCGDEFDYDTWEGHYELVKLNLNNPQVKEHLFAAVKYWIEEFKIDGLRLDAADCLELDFIEELVDFCKEIKSDFWLLGEIIHGDYRTWTGQGMLDSVTNYECYKGLYSSHNDKNYFEIAHSLERQFGEKGKYKNLPLYSFVDNHDVNRIASTLNQASHLYPIHILLFTIPGVPSIYYGSEWGIAGQKNNHSDAPLRPELNFARVSQESLNKDLATTITELSEIYHDSSALKYGDYQQLLIKNEQFVFARVSEEEIIVTALNLSDEEIELEFELDLPVTNANKLLDLIDESVSFRVNDNGKVKIDMPSCWGRIMKLI